MKEIPISKIYEAYSALADGRITKVDASTFLIASSDASKVYTVLKEGNVYSSNDNATLWQHYAGYPIVATLLQEGRISVDKSLLPHFKGIPWKRLNIANHNDYDKAIKEAFKDVDKKTFEKIQEEMEKTRQEVLALDLIIKGNRKKRIVPDK